MIYFDNAATTYPKPPQVVNAVSGCMENFCGNPGRGSHYMARRAAEALYLCRETAANFFGCEDSDRIIFCQNATHALNTAIFGLFSSGDHLLISDMEHNSVLRPVDRLKRLGARYSVFSTSGDVCANISRLIKKNTKAVICIHASNIINKTLPIYQIGKLCKKAGILFVLDASQSAGVLDVNMKRDNISALCTAGHKGLMGPQGTGILLLSKNVIPEPLLYGGSGIASMDIDMPDFFPDRLEAGTANTPAIWGLYHGIKYIEERGRENIFQYEKQLCRYMHRCLEKIEGIRLYSKPNGSICLFNIDRFSSQKTGDLLDKNGICTRSGLHCAPLAHKTLKTPPGGAVRASVGAFNTIDEIEYFASVVKKIRLSV